MSSQTPAEILLADGVPITLADGSKHHLIMDFGSLMHIEKEWGTLNAYLFDLRNNWKGPIMQLTYIGVVAGLHHERGTYDRAANPPLSPEPAVVNEYYSAVADAMAVVFPPVAPGKAPAASSEKKANSRGAGTTTKQQSSSAEAIERSSV